MASYFFSCSHWYNTWLWHITLTCHSLKTPLFTSERQMTHANMGEPTCPQHINAIASIISLDLQPLTALLEHHYTTFTRKHHDVDSCWNKSIKRKVAQWKQRSNKLFQRGSRPCPVAYGYLLSEKDTHGHCPACLGIVQTKLALSNLPVARHVPLLSLGDDPEAALAVFGEATGSWVDSVEAKKSLWDDDNIPLTVPEFYQDFWCSEDDYLDWCGQGILWRVEAVAPLIRYRKACALCKNTPTTLSCNFLS